MSDIRTFRMPFCVSSTFSTVGVRRRWDVGRTECQKEEERKRKGWETREDLKSKKNVYFIQNAYTSCTPSKDFKKVGRKMQNNTKIEATLVFSQPHVPNQAPHKKFENDCASIYAFKFMSFFSYPMFWFLPQDYYDTYRCTRGGWE